MPLQGKHGGMVPVRGVRLSVQSCRQLAALRARRRVRVEAVVDPLEAPMPPKVPVGRARSFALALAPGEPDRAAIASEAISERIREIA